MTDRDRRVLLACALVGLVTAAWAAVAIPARATYGERTTADEPQYLLSALSLAEDRDLYVDDEIADERYRPFHEVDLPVQTDELDGGRALSPHDPLLPAVLAVPMGLGGWAAAKATLAALAGVLAGLLTWAAHRRFAVPLGVAATVVLAFSATAPLAGYGTQVYPELPAALATTVAIVALTGPLRRGGLVALALAVTALPWLGVKYAPVAVVLAVLGAGRLWRDGRARALLALVGGLAVAGVAYLVGHRLLYGGWTVYAAGDHFVGSEFDVVGTEPNYLGRSRRLTGLLLDRTFGLAVWMPAYLLAVPALAVLVARRPRGWPVLVAPLAAGWATATWVALTMHGWWWPGRQVVVVLPCVVLAVAWWAGRARRVLPAVVALGVVGALNWLWLVVEVLQLRLRLIVDFPDTRNPVVRSFRVLLPDDRAPTAWDGFLTAAWVVALVVAAVVAVRLSRSPRARTPRPAPAPGGRPVPPTSSVPARSSSR
jgi:hypothetical protein